MATTTTNYGLTKPDTTDNFADFRKSYNDNLDIIDQNLGGGGGGTTTDLFSIFDSVRLSQRYNTGAIADGEFTFSIDENANDWSSNVTATNTTAVDLSDFDKLRLTIEITDQSDYGYFYVTLSQTAYTWADYVWPSVYANENSILKIDSSGVYEIDVSLLSGNYYIYIGATTGKDTTSSGDCTNSHNGKIVGSVTDFVGVAESSGSSVIANPADPATDDLITVEIDGVVYAIPGSGGGGGSETKTLVYTLGAGQRWETFPNPGSSNPLLVEAVNQGVTSSWRVEPTELPSRSGGDYYITLGVVPGTNTAVNMAQTDNGDTVYISTNYTYDTNVASVKVYTVSGGSGGGSGYKADVLVTGIGDLATVNLAHPITDYDQIMLVGRSQADGADSRLTAVYDVEYIRPLIGTSTRFGVTSNDWFLWYSFSNASTMQKSANSWIWLETVIGIKYQGGGGGSYSVEYSTSEREVGQWIDGRAVYEKTYDLVSALACAAQVYTDTGISKGVVDKILHAQILSDDGGFLGATNVNLSTNTDHIGIYNGADSAVSVKQIVLQYVKSHNLHLIEFIEGTGTQWIDTGIKPTLTTVIKAGIYPKENSGEVLIGNCVNDGSDYRLFNYGGQFYFDFGGDRWNGNSLPENTYSEVELGNYYAKKNGVEIFNNTPISSTGDWSNNNIYFLYKQDNQSISKARLYYLKIYNNGNLVFDAVPVNDSNDVPCLFDFISGNYIYNSGTGDFVAGPDL